MLSPCFGYIFLKKCFDTGNCHLLMCLTGKHIPVRLMFNASAYKIFFQHLRTMVWYPNPSCFPSFSNNVNGCVGISELYFPDDQITHFLCSCTCLLYTSDAADE